MGSDWVPSSVTRIGRYEGHVLRTSMAHADIHKHMQAKSRAIIDTGVDAAKLKVRVAGYVRDRVNSRQSVGTSGGEYNCM